MKKLVNKMPEDTCNGDIVGGCSEPRKSSGFFMPKGGETPKPAPSEAADKVFFFPSTRSKQKIGGIRLAVSLKKGGQNHLIIGQRHQPKSR